MIEGSRSARSDHRQVHGIGNGSREFQIVAGLSAVPVHAGGEDRPSPELFTFPGPDHGIPADRFGPPGNHQFKT